MPAFESEEDLVRLLDKLDEESSDRHDDLSRRMNENLELFRGKQWKSDRAPYFLYNIVESTLEDKVGKLSETRPKIDVMPTRNGLEASSDMIKAAISSIWDKRRVEYRTERLGMFGALAGAAFVGTPFNASLDHGRGDIDFVVKDPRLVKVDPSVTQADEIDQGEYVIIEDCVPLDLLKSRYPGRAADLKPEDRMSGFAPPKPATVTTMLKAAKSKLFGQDQDRAKSVLPKGVVKEYYIQDRRKNINDLGTVPLVSGLTKWAEEGTPFPGGRRIFRAGKVILEDSYNPFWDGLYPIDMMSWKIDLETVWGSDEVQPIKRLQEAINRLGDAYTKTAVLNSVVRVILDYGALTPDERNKLSNTIGEIIEKAPGRAFDYQVPPLLSPEVVQFMQQLIEWAREKVGVTQSPAQKDLPSIVTGPAIEGLQLMVEGPIRTSARRIEEIYQRVGQKQISRVFQYYTADRLVHLIGPTKEWMAFEFDRMKLIKGADGKPRTQEDIRKAYRDFYFAIEPGSSLAITRMQRAMLKQQLVEAGWLHPREIMEDAGFRNADEKIAEAQEAQKAGLFEAFFNKDGRKKSGQNSLDSFAA